MKSILAFCLLPLALAADEPFEKAITPFVKQHCVSCHGPEKQKAKLRLDTLKADFSDPATSAKWKEVVDSIGGHSMPPEEEEQPSPDSAAAVASWLELELAKAEIAKRSAKVVLRRMNRAEYGNTIRDLIGIELPALESFPEDPPAGGFDNIGQALGMSPMQVELYFSAARQALDMALVDGEQPKPIKWHFEPEENTLGTDRYRVKVDGHRILLNHGKNPTQNGFTVIHHESWDKGVGFRDFKVPHEGEYVIRFRAASRVPTREAVMTAVTPMLEKQRDEEIAKRPNATKYHEERFQRQLTHFRTSSHYEYGPSRVKISRHLGGTPAIVGEMDVAAPESAPQVYEVRTRFTKESARIDLDYHYDVPSELENQVFINNDAFPRPTLLIDWVELEGPICAVWPPASHRSLLFDSPNKDKDEKAYASEVLARFMSRAFRRPLHKGELEAKLALFDKHRAEKSSFVEAIKVPLAAVLASPHFLYLVEPAADATRTLSAHELASRLSYFLWSSMPDEELLNLANAGKLSQPAVLTAQVNRLLADERSAAFVKNFAGQWLGLRKVGVNPPSQNLYPEYDRHLEISIVRETEGFFAEVLRSDLNARTLIQSDFVTINERLARFYGISGVKGDDIRRVPVPPDSHRGGLITQASIHSITSNGTRTSPVARGVWVMKTLLGMDPGLPVANVGEIQSKVPGIDKATVRQRLAIHREAASCARCHNRIDPLGLAMENFDASGKWREQEGHGHQGRIEKNDPVIDASAKMPDGSTFVGVEGLQAQLLKNEDLFLTSLATQLTTYALGRELGFSDRAPVRGFVEQMKAQKSTLRSLITAIVGSELFSTK